VADSVTAQGDWWIASAADVARWWVGRGTTSVTFDPVGAGTISGIQVIAPPNQGVEDLWLDVVIPSAPGGLVPLVGGRPVDFAATPWGMRVPVGDLSEGEERTISFVVLEADEPPPAR
jgi:hypothetical protein